ncbi:hypothetical protein BCR39DRAFT_528484 [Naematelia encephala]|uniref:Prokaryotic phospholipase A2-domain-containing protein n=1 Tax=Naematelia encephala TaxID=71784 RepID=A0A1Y2B9Q6_9TREE|nr:hypothetical protein BCR39DRAFT_528484 [Naematelia encephala]
MRPTNLLLLATLTSTTFFNGDPTHSNNVTSFGNPSSSWGVQANPTTQEKSRPLTRDAYRSECKELVWAGALADDRNSREGTSEHQAPSDAQRTSIAECLDYYARWEVPTTNWLSSSCEDIMFNAALVDRTDRSFARRHGGQITLTAEQYKLRRSLRDISQWCVDYQAEKTAREARLREDSNADLDSSAVSQPTSEVSSATAETSKSVEHVSGIRRRYDL